jgi:acyl-CoA synthetase (AMP-forming)/AMP-acid ligase II/acyl carrier protein
MIGGEILDIKLLNKVKRISKAKIYNMYGPTETTVWSTIADITNTEHINIGKEILNTEVYILDEEGNQVPEGQVGEICIAGDGLALGYLNREDLTNEKFINSSFAFRGRIYKTGDLGKRTDGILYCIGRIDNQVKIRGYRVELEEIESIAAKCRGVERAVAIVKNEDILSLFLKTSSEIDSEDIKKFMSERLPNYMVPSQFIQIDEFPYTSNGKVDRNKLKKMLDENYDEQLIKSNTKGTLNEIEAKIATIIYDLLEIDNLEFDKYISFTSLGITSISYIQIIVAVEAEFEIEFDDEILAYDSSKNISELGKCVELKLC